MDEEDTRSYKQPCPQCSEVHWGISDEGTFYCKNCHTIIEKTKEVDESNVLNLNARIQSINRGLRKPKKNDWGWEWYICEGFQFILLKQAEALEALGIGSGIKDKVMCNLWRLFLRQTKQAYCKRPIRQKPQLHLSLESSEASSDVGSKSDVCSTDVSTESDGEQSSLGLPSSGYSEVSDVESASSAPSGSVDGSIQIKKKPCHHKMSMPMTLAFCYLSLLWVRASVTLSDLLRLVFYHHIPYYNPQEFFPEKTRLYGVDIYIFEVQQFPVYSHILQLASDLGKVLKLPQFPPITETSYYHPNVLCMKYLMEVNLPDELHHWTCFVAKKARLDDVTVLTYNPGLKKKEIIPYDIQAVAIIIVVLKLIFVLDDDLEWQLAKRAQKENQGENDITIFDFEKWYMTMRPCMDEARRKLEEENARFPWYSKSVLYYTRKSSWRLMKRKRMAKNLQRQFSKLAGTAPDAGNPGPSSFVFNWEEPNTGKICFHAHSLKGITQKGKKPLFHLKKKYWLNTVKKCSSDFCEHYDESQFPSSYCFVISLFSTVLRVEPNVIHYEVSLVEKKLFSKIPRRRPAKRLRKRKL
ncbi:TATA box-binding protein-associated factor RNA polymerase I subunit B isoform X1 [Bufo bufo]|uniref:TATA box-binding protein-associated factor RNA polymerase I subunit B isoform X1 n=2 Tax=Bufo bufo TaxID=8384 RepID=UPI001ABEE187|nr:TATA box-binding protein-associated factor RNA polymerase I subunit B isoform X1 [Bufo bufo]